MSVAARGAYMYEYLDDTSTSPTAFGPTCLQHDTTLRRAVQVLLLHRGIICALVDRQGEAQPDVAIAG